MASSKTVLVIEDDKGITEVMRTIFLMHGINTVFADNGQDGLRMLAANDIDLIICDFMLPDINGDKILSAVKTNPITAAIPFIFLSAFADADDINKGLELGADLYITKPFSAPHLINVVKEKLTPVA